MPGDYDGDGKSDPAVWRPGPGIWYVLNSASNYTTSMAVNWGSGARGDVPVVGDFDGDGQADITLWLPGQGLWYILRSSANYAASSVLAWGSGAAADIPLP